MNVALERTLNEQGEATRAREIEREHAMSEFVPIIKSLARRMASSLPPSLDERDLESAGAIGLMDAMARFDPSKGARLKTYAEIRIHGAMIDEIRSHDWLPRHVRYMRTRIEKTHSLLQARLGRPPNRKELAAKLQMSEEELEQHQHGGQDAAMCNVHDLVLQDKNGSAVPRQLIDDTQPDPLCAAMANSLREFLGKAIDALPSQERLVLSLYYYEDLSMHEIAAVLKVSLSRVSQIHSKAIRELRARLGSTPLP